MADVGSGGENHGPVYVDVYGTGHRMHAIQRRGVGPDQPHGFEGPHPDGPFWLRGLKGQLPLFLVFWFGFVFGHGVVLVLTVGTLLIAVVLGMTIDPERINESVIAAWIAAGVVATVMAIFVAWAAISVWRSAGRSENRKWAIAARAVVVAYVAFWAAVIYNVAV